MKLLKYIICFIFVLGIILVAYLYSVIWATNVPAKLSSEYVEIPSGTTLPQLSEQLVNEGFIKNKSSFNKVAKWMNYNDSSIKSGRYRLVPESSNRELIQLLRSGKQTAVELTYNNLRSLEQLAGKLTAPLMIDSSSMYNALTNTSIQEQYGYTRDDFMSLFIPNSYQIWWNISEEDLIKKISVEHGRFWNTERTNKAAAIGLTTREVYTLASIVEKETLALSEKNRIAGVYINRLKKGMKLQADPTVVYAVGDFTIRRVLNKHLSYDSPYNTYLYNGLPPGPICMPEISSIDAVLNYEEHNYIFFCAKPDNSGKHAFARTNAQHSRNANAYRSWLNKRKVMK